ncbi:hypothetical protein KFS98_003689 [Salmonella enterica]|nr:hypothetical protein [Salmonella enterica]
MSTTDAILDPGTRYVKPGVYIQQEQIPRVEATADYQRIPCYVGRGSNQLLYQNKAVIRGYVKNELLSFPQQAPYSTRLKYNGDGNKENASLVTSEGDVLDSRLWDFILDGSTQNVTGVRINSSAYDPTFTYLINYQSTDASVLDDTGISSLSRILNMGYQAGNSDLLPEYFDLEVKLGDFAIGAPSQNIVANDGFGDTPNFRTDLSKYVGPTRTFTLIVDAIRQVFQPNLLNYTASASNVGTGSMALNIQNWTGSTDTAYTFTVTEIGAGTAFIKLKVTRDVPAYTGEITVKVGFERNVPILDSIYADFGDLTLYKVNDVLTYEIGNRDTPLLEVAWYAEDITGGQGQLNINHLNRDAVEFTSGLQIQFGSDLTLYKEGDAFTATVENTGRIQWKYDLETVEKVAIGNIGQDKTGAVTGTRNAWFAQLRETRATKVKQIEVQVGNLNVILPPEEWKFDADAKHITFKTKPGGTLTVSLEYTRAPNFGQTYYLSAEALRPESMYNTVIALTKENYRSLVGYPVSGNDLAIMAEIALEVVGVPQIAVIQVQDADRDGKYVDADYRKSIVASRESKLITDLCVLANSSVINDIMNELDYRNDPFLSSPTYGWFGYPVNTPIGTALQEQGSLAYYGGQVMKVPAGSLRAGRVLSSGSCWGKRTITTRTGYQQELTLDGTFIAGTIAAMNAALTEPSDSLLRKELPAFTSVQTFTDVELGVIGQHQFILLEQAASSIKIMDITTHDSSAPDMKQLNAMNQKDYTTAIVRQKMKDELISIVPDSQEDGEMLVGNALMQILQQLSNNGKIGKYQNADGSVRQIAVDRDIWVHRKDNDPTAYYFRYAFYLRYHIGRLFGTYRVDQDLLNSTS